MRLAALVMIALTAEATQPTGSTLIAIAVIGAIAAVAAPGVAALVQSLVNRRRINETQATAVQADARAVQADARSAVTSQQVTTLSAQTMRETAATEVLPAATEMLRQVLASRDEMRRTWRDTQHELQATQRLLKQCEERDRATNERVGHLEHHLAEERKARLDLVAVLAELHPDLPMRAIAEQDAHDPIEGEG